MEKKYSLTNESKIVDGHTVYRIIAEKDFDCVKKGTLGGFVESEKNLSHKDNCWIDNNAMVYGNARIYDDAKIYDRAMVCDNARIFDYARIYNNALVFDNAKIYDLAKAYNNAKICDNAEVREEAQIYGDARVYGNTKICGNAEVYDVAKVYGFSYLHGNAIVNQEMWIESAFVNCVLSDNLAENIRCQTGLGIFDNKIVAYKQVNKDMMSFYDSNFKYEVGKVIEVEDAEISNQACASGLHFSNMNYWNQGVGEDTGYLIAEINIGDIITVQRGKIRCKRAKILGTYNI